MPDPNLPAVPGWLGPGITTSPMERAVDRAIAEEIEHASMGQTSFYPVKVSCAVHGPMRERFHLCRWVCNGYDGEGCEVYLDHEEAYYITKRMPPDRSVPVEACDLERELAWEALYFGGRCAAIKVYPKGVELPDYTEGELETDG